MDRTVKLLLDKVTQLTNRFNSLTQNSKKIHELPNAASKENVYISVSDGANTGKVIYEPSEVSKEEFENIAGLYFTVDPSTGNILVKSADGNVLSNLNINFLVEDVVKFTDQTLSPTQQQTARDNIAALGTADLDGFVYDVTYNSTNHQITFYSQNEPNIVIDLPIEQLIKGVQLVGDDLVFTFEDGSTVTVPLNTLLVGVVKSVNGLIPNSQGEIIINITDIPGLSSELAAKANTNGNYPNMTVGTSQLALKWNEYDGTNLADDIFYFQVFDLAANKWRPGSIQLSKDKLGIGTNPDFVKKSETNQQNVAGAMLIQNVGIGNVPGYTRMVRINADNLALLSDADGWAQLTIEPGTLNVHAVTLGQLNTILNSYALASAIPTNNNQLANGAGYITAAALSGYVLQSSLNTQLTAYATLAGTQTFSGQITFGVAPIVPNGTLAGHTVNLGQMQNYVTTEVATEVTNQITNLEFAPKAYSYRNITSNNTVIAVRQFRRVVAVFSDPSVITVDLPSDAFPGTVVTLQTTNTLVTVTMDYRRPNSSGSSLNMEPNMSLQVSFDEDNSTWIVEQYNNLS